MPTNIRPSNFGAFVGAAISRPVVSPMGKQRRRKAPTIQCQIFSIEIRRYNVETWYILQHRYITGPIRFCPETCHVGGRILSAPTAHRNIRSGNSSALCYNVVRPAENQLVKFWIHLPWRIMRPPMMHFTRSMAWIRPNRGMIPIPVNRLRTKAVGTHTAQTKQLSNRKVTMV